MHSSATRKKLPRSPGQWVQLIFVACALSWIVPSMILLAPDLARTYVHMWKAVLGIEPDCKYPAARWTGVGPDCADIEKAAPAHAAPPTP